MKFKLGNKPGDVDDEVVCDVAKLLDAVDVVLDGVGGGLVLAQVHANLDVDRMSFIGPEDVNFIATPSVANSLFGIPYGGEPAENGIVANAIEPVSERGKLFLQGAATFKQGQDLIYLRQPLKKWQSKK